MKILHTSDWHLGHTLYNYDRTEEHKKMLEQMVEIVKNRKPDVFLLCGDVFHTAQPSTSVQTLFSNALVQIHEAHPDMHIIVTAGNHDSGTRHEIFRTPWQALNVHTIGTFEKNNLEAHIIEIPGVGYVIAMPYIYERNIPDGLFQQLTDRVTARNDHNLPIVIMAHTTVAGSDFTGHEQADEKTVGGIDSMDIQQFGSGYDYLALGHIHHAQFVHTGKHNVRYSGTPLPISFDETFEHSVTWVNICNHDDQPEIETIAINNPYPLVTLPTHGTANWNDAKDLLMQFPEDNPAYIRLNVEIEDFLPTDAYAQANLLSSGKLCRLCYIKTQRKNERQKETKTLTIQEFQTQDPITIAEYFAESTGISFDEEMKKLFNETLELIKNDTQNA